VSEVTEHGTGEGEGERDGQESMERRSDDWLAVTECGWIKTAGEIIQGLATIHFINSTLPDTAGNNLPTR